jgi:putative transcriptional regulator
MRRSGGRHGKKMESSLDINSEPGYSLMESQLYMMPSIINRVKELRVAQGWTQEQLAEAAGVSRQSVNSIERNRYVPSLELALKFARIFACPTEQIFQLEKQP